MTAGKMYRHPLRAIHGSGANLRRGTARENQYFCLIGKAVFRHQAVFTMRQLKPLPLAFKVVIALPW